LVKSARQIADPDLHSIRKQDRKQRELGEYPDEWVAGIEIQHSKRFRSHDSAYKEEQDRGGKHGPRRAF
jgi:hypothetical protein